MHQSWNWSKTTDRHTYQQIACCHSSRLSLSSNRAQDTTQHSGCNDGISHLGFTTGAAKIKGLYEAGFMPPPQPQAQCPLRYLRYIQEYCCSLPLGKHGLERSPCHNCCHEWNCNDGYHFMGTAVLLVCGCYCYDIWFKVVTAPHGPEGSFYLGHGCKKCCILSQMLHFCICCAAHWTGSAVWMLLRLLWYAQLWG